jgi:DnaJ-class molecular chaperone
LTDSEKRKIYNYTGEEPGNNQSRPNNRRGGGGFNEDNINPEEIFNMFFGGMGGGVHQR